MDARGGYDFRQLLVDMVMFYYLHELDQIINYGCQRRHRHHRRRRRRRQRQRQ